MGDSELAQADLAHHRVPGLVQELARQVDVVLCATSYLTPMTIESGPIRCSARVVLNPASVIQPMQSEAV